MEEMGRHDVSTVLESGSNYSQYSSKHKENFHGSAGGRALVRTRKMSRVLAGSLGCWLVEKYPALGMGR
jgi:hypothetical protein